MEQFPGLDAEQAELDAEQAGLGGAEQAGLSADHPTDTQDLNDDSNKLKDAFTSIKDLLNDVKTDKHPFHQLILDMERRNATKHKLRDLVISLFIMAIIKKPDLLSSADLSSKLPGLLNSWITQNPHSKEEATYDEMVSFCEKWIITENPLMSTVDEQKKKEKHFDLSHLWQNLKSPTGMHPDGDTGILLEQLTRLFTLCINEVDGMVRKMNTYYTLFADTQAAASADVLARVGFQLDTMDSMTTKLRQAENKLHDLNEQIEKQQAVLSTKEMDTVKRSMQRDHADEIQKLETRH